MKEIAILKNAREGRMMRRGSGDFREDAFGGLNAAIDTIIRIPELRVES